MSPSWVWSVLYFGGMLLAFIGERVVGAGTSRGVTTGLGIALAAVALAARATRAKRAPADRRVVEMMLLALYAIGIFAVALYLIQSDLALFGKPLDRDWPRLATVLSALWPAVWLFATLPILLAEFSYAAVARAPKLEVARVRDAVWSGIGLAGAVVFAFALAYVGAERDKKADLSYFRTARAGESTRKLVATMDQPVQVALFFPPANDVKEEVESYFDDLKKESKLFEVQHYDRDVDPQKAKELGVSGNGIVVIARGQHREQLSIGLELESARGQLRNLDRDVQQRLLKVARPARTVYFVTGHGERGFDPANDTDKRGTVRDLRDLLTQQGYNVRTLGAADGLGADVPADAGIVLVIGPQKPMLPEESASLNRYLDRGGRMFVALDPESGLTEDELLKPMGVKYVPTMLASDVAYGRRANQLSDRANIATGTFSSHPSVTTLGRYGGRAPMVLLGAGSFEELKDKPAGYGIDVTVRAHVSTWNDLNGNFQFDAPQESRKQWELAVAVAEKKKNGKAVEAKDEGRAILLADSDMVSDGWVGAQGNPLFVIDGMKWLIGDEAITGEITNENDVPIVHTRKQDQLWFYGSSFLAPALILGFGFFVTRRRALRSGKSSKNKKEKAS
jgi:hypothetical protein